MPGYARLPQYFAQSVSVTPTGDLTATNVQSALVELDTDSLAKSAYTTKGDLITASASSATIRLPVGTNGQVLTASSSATGGLTWTAAGGSGSKAFSLFTGGM